MLSPARQNRSRKQTAVTRSIPAPVGGLNARDSLADMDEKDAVILENFFCEETYVSIRGGYTSHKTEMTDGVETLLVWNGPTSSKMFAANDGNIYDATTSGAIGAAAVSSLTNDRWSYVNFTTSGGSFIVAVNGADDPLNYNGTTWATTPAITGVTPADLNYVISHKERLWFIEKNSMSAWYLGTQAIGGAATEYPLGSVFREGGYLLAIGTLSGDSGTGPDDYIAFLSSEGEMVVYAGTDPTSASTWSLVGRYKVGKPLGIRPIANMGGDMLILTRDGVVSGLSMMRKDRTEAEYSAVTKKINSLINADAKNFGGNFGWAIQLYTRGRMLIVNVPKTDGEEQVQYVMNVNTGAWSKFTGLNANCWAILDDRLYFGGDGVVYKADNGTSDAGNNIRGELKGAFQYFGTRGRLKHFKMLRPIISSTGVPKFLVGIDVDYANRTPSGVLSPPEATGMAWGSMYWGSMMWGGAENIIKYWTTVFGIGMCASPHFVVVCNGQTCSVNSFDFVMEPGGAL